MKKLFTFVFTMLLGAGLAFAQTGAGTTGDTATTGQTKQTTGKKGSKTKAHKGGKKHKKGTSTAVTPAPK